MAKARKITKKPIPRATHVGLGERIQIVGKMLLEGRTRSSILRYSKSEWKRSVRQTDEYIKRATAEIDEANQASAERNLALITANLWKLYRSNFHGDPSVARHALMDIAKLRGLEKLELSITVERPLKELTDDALEAALSGGT